jgi:hypothetical protein
MFLEFKFSKELDTQKPTTFLIAFLDTQSMPTQNTFPDDQLPENWLSFPNYSLSLVPGFKRKISSFDIIRAYPE